MGAFHEIGVRTVTVDINQSLLEIIGSTVMRTRVLEISCVAVNSGGVVTMGLGRPAAAGVIPTSPVALTPEIAGDAAPTTTVATAWVLSPTNPTVYMRKHHFSNTQPGGFTWRFPTGIVLAQSGVGRSLVLQLLVTDNAEYDVWVVVEEV